MKTLVFFILFLVLCHFIGVHWLYVAARIIIHGVAVLSQGV